MRELEGTCSVLHLPFWPYAKLFLEWSQRPACVIPGRGDGINMLARLMNRLPGKEWDVNWKLQRIALRASRHMRPMGVDLLDKPFDQIDNLEDPAFVDRARDARYLVCAGWEYGCWSWLERHAGDVRSQLAPLPVYCDPAAAFIAELRKRYDVLIGLFARRGDYRTFFEGRFYFAWSDYRRWIREILDLHPGRRVAIVAASDDPIPMEEFRGLPVIPTSGSVNRGGHWMESFLELAQCDLILSPPSTFAACAAFYGDIPWWPLRSSGQTLRTDQMLASTSSRRRATRRWRCRFADRHPSCCLLFISTSGPRCRLTTGTPVRQTRRFHSGPIFCVIPPESRSAPEIEELGVHGIVNKQWDPARPVQACGRSPG